MSPDRIPPRLVADEKETLRQFLDYLRESVIAKASGLEGEQLARRMVPSGTSLVWLVRHLTRVEMIHLQVSFEGRDVALPPAEADGGDAPDLIAAYRAAIRESNDIIGRCADLSQLAVRPRGPDGQAMPLRWTLVHLIEETARHAGHADILREQLDGSVGR
ncbi:MAG: DinB family protein [Acidimicrobiales bacterium]|nr:DinB family protein [Acidimicrobiales bacterium]MBO0887241.1 DinB family protein [Acidimicrobiales bacterium]